MSDRDTPSGSRPVNEPPVRTVGALSRKSSADSISRSPPDDGRLANAIRPSGAPVVNVNGSAKAELVNRKSGAANNRGSARERCFIEHLSLDTPWPRWRRIQKQHQIRRALITIDS